MEFWRSESLPPKLIERRIQRTIRWVGLYVEFSHIWRVISRCPFDECDIPTHWAALWPLDKDGEEALHCRHSAKLLDCEGLDDIANAMEKRPDSRENQQRVCLCGEKLASGPEPK